MNSRFIIEGIGYLGSILVVVSMLMTSVKKLRIVNTTGCIIFTVYALIIHSYPAALMNFCIILINIYQLIRLGRQEENYRLIKGNTNSGSVPYLVDYYLEDIRKFFPEASMEGLSKCDTAFFIIYETTPAGVFIGNMEEEGCMKIWLDYSLPAYRDSTVGAFLYKHLPDVGIKKIVFTGRSEGHEKYMMKMGFVKTDEGYVKEL
ncbi:MAG: YgjV family protein [Lachnospiraceae bacterium]|nr:YgjV family protein [Lachnospiraceae bacterium]